MSQRQRQRQPLLAPTSPQLGAALVSEQSDLRDLPQLESRPATPADREEPTSNSPAPNPSPAAEPDREPSAPRNPDERDPRPVDFTPPSVNLTAWDPKDTIFPPEPAPVILEAPNKGERPLDEVAVVVPDSRLELALSGIVVTFRSVMFHKGLGPDGEPDVVTNIAQAVWTWGLDEHGNPKQHVLNENVDPYDFNGMPITAKHEVQNRLLARFVQWRQSILKGETPASCIG